MNKKDKPWDNLPLKDFRVTLYPKPKTFVVSEQTHVGAIRMAVQKYQSDLHIDDEFFREDVMDLTEVESWPEQLNK